MSAYPQKLFRVDLHQLIARIIKPHVEGQGKRECCAGACTAVIESTNGNYDVAQALLKAQVHDNDVERLQEGPHSRGKLLEALPRTANSSGAPYANGPYEV